MKNYLLILYFMLVSTLSDAQPTYQNSIFGNLPASAKLWRSHVQQFKASTPPALNKTTAIKQRLIAGSSYAYDQGYHITDTISLKYSGTRGILNDYSDPFLYLYSSDPAAFRSYVAFDTSVELSNESMVGQPLLISNRVFCTYDANDRLLQKTTQSHSNNTYSDSLKIERTYNAQNKLTTENSFTFNKISNQWDLTSAYRLTYNAQGQVNTDTLLIDLGAGLIPMGLTLFNYYPTGELQTLTYKVIGLTNTWEHLMKDSLGYSNSAMVFERIFTWNGMNWENFVEDTRHLNANNLPDSVFIRGWDASSNAWQLSEVYVYTHNSNGNPDGVDLYDNTNSLWLKFHYYYELYNDDLGVGHETKQSFTVFPNPVTSILQVNSADTGPVSVQLLSLTGQVVMNRNYENGSKITISMASLPAGTYLLKLNDKGQTLHSQLVVKN